jgi:TPR repeat protein
MGAAGGERARAAPKAADQGDQLAQFKIGLLYYNGKGVAQDYAQAMSWYRKAADQGYDRKAADQGFEAAKADLKRLSL